MIKCEVIEEFSLKDFDKLVNIKRGSAKEKYGYLYVRDTFECDEEMAKYLTGNNALKKVVVKVIEVEPEKKVEKELIYCGDETTQPQYIEKETKPKKKKSSKK